MQPVSVPANSTLPAVKQKRESSQTGKEWIAALNSPINGYLYTLMQPVYVVANSTASCEAKQGEQSGAAEEDKEYER